MIQCEECGFGDGVHDTPCVVDPRQRKAAPVDIEVTIGWTRSEVVDGQLVYSSFGDGYKPGASQHTETITVSLDPEQFDVERIPHTIADAVFTATNHPTPESLDGLYAQVYEAIKATGYNGRGAHYSLSVGDTVTAGEVMLACASLGWERAEGRIG